MPVVVEVRLVGLALGFEQQRRLLQKRHAELRADRPAPARGSSGARPPALDPCSRCGGFTVNSCTRSPSSSSSSSCGSRQALDVLVAVARQPDLNLVLAVQRKRCTEQRAAARADRQTLEVLLLREVGRSRIVSPPGERLGRPTASRLIFSAAET